MGFRLFEESESTESVLAGPPGIEPGLSVLETDVLPLYDGPSMAKIADNRVGEKSPVNASRAV